MDASTSIELIPGGTVIRIALPVTHNVGFLSPGRFDMARHSKAAGANHARYSKRANVRSSASLLLPYLGAANGANFDPRSYQRINNARRATVSKKSGFSLSSAALGGIIAGSVVVLWLFFVFLYLKRRSRRRRRANVSDVENRDLLPASYDPSSRGSLSMIQSIDSPRLNPSPAPLPSQQRPQPSFEGTAPASLPAPSNPRPQIPSGDVRKARLGRPPPLVLRRERPDHEARQGDPFTMSRSRSTRRTEGTSRVSVLPNPWDSGAKPSPGAFELVFLGLPSFSEPVRPANSFKVGLPRTPRKTRTFRPHEVRSLEVTQLAADRITFEPRRGPSRT